MKIIYTVIISALMLPQALKAQLLDSIIPVTCTHSILPDNVSFLLTATDISSIENLPVSYVSSIQIIDANNPWPPRWFATNPHYMGIKPPFVAMMPYNASFQQGEIIFYTIINAGSENVKSAPYLACILCNRQLEPVDTFSPNNKRLDIHDFRLTNDGEKMYFDKQDTVINAREIFGTDTSISLEYENIQISNSKGSVIYCWDPLIQLGVKAFYRPYREELKSSIWHKTCQWSLGNSLYFDYDGNILYSFKHIGIGKISRKDGHIIWRIDRNNLKPNDLSDTIPLYAQHDLQSVKDENGNVIYTVISNGDSFHPQFEAIQFTVKESKKDKPVIKLLKNIASPVNITKASTGNYEVEKDGCYLWNYGNYNDDETIIDQVPWDPTLWNYGNYNGDATAGQIRFEYRDKNDQLLGQYTTPSRVFFNRVQKLYNWGPPRPVLIEKNGYLLSSSNEPKGTWYMLAGKDLKIVKEVGSGSKFKPSESGYYCLAVKYGLGYSVSKAVKYTK